jgi:hypothetical protein
MSNNPAVELHQVKDSGTPILLVLRSRRPIPVIGERTPTVHHFPWRLRRASTPLVRSAAAVEHGWFHLLPMVFQLISFVVIACYVQVLVAGGSGLLAAVLAAVAVAVGAQASTSLAPFRRSAR